jgi:hypothetical protein
MSLAKFAAKLGSGARAAGNTVSAVSNKYPKSSWALSGAAGIGLGRVLNKALGGDKLELGDIDDLDDAGEYGKQSLRKLIAKLGLED